MPTTESIQALLDELVKKRLVDQKVAKKIDFSAILWFFETELGKELIKQKSMSNGNNRFRCYYLQNGSLNNTQMKKMNC